MTQKLTILFDLDGTLVDTAPDLLTAHNHVMEKFGYKTKNLDQIKDLVGKGAAVMLGRSVWGSARKELSKIDDQKIKDKMVKEFIDFYGKNIVVKSKLVNGVYNFLNWAKSNVLKTSKSTIPSDIARCSHIARILSSKFIRYYRIL